jgi:hypothetical protein
MRIEFEVMGLDNLTSDFLNWAMANRDNLEMLKEYNTLKIISNVAVLHFDHQGIIKVIEDRIRHKRFVIV